MTHVHTPAAEGRSQDLTTPRALFLQLDAEFRFDLDAAADETNALCPRFFSIENDALAQDWTGTVFVNPPYKFCEAFVRKAAREAARGATVVMLVPVRADTGWWHDVALKHEIRWIRGRLKFGYARRPAERSNWTTAPFACCVLVLRPMALPSHRPNT